MNRIALLTFAVVLVAPAAFGSGATALLDLAPPDAKVVYGVNVQKTLASPFGQIVYRNVLAHSPALQQFAPAAGLDLQRDVTELLFVGTDVNRRGRLPRYDLVLARGKFRPERFAVIAKFGGATLTEDHSLQIITLPPLTMHFSMVFLDPQTAALGSVTALQALIARGNSKTTLPSALTQRVTSVSESNDVWYATVTPLSELALGRSPLANTGFDAIRESSGGIKFDRAGATVSVEGLAGSDQDAQTLASILTMAMQAIKNARNAPLGKAQFTASGSAIHGHVQIQEADLERLLLRGISGRSY